MAKHQFGIMETPPQKGIRYDEFEPEKYDCIDVDDDFIELLCPMLMEIPTYYHTLDKLDYNLAYCGITLIPPQSSSAISEIIAGNIDLQSLKALMDKAVKENKYVIHYGL